LTMLITPVVLNTLKWSSITPVSQLTEDAKGWKIK
jgi:hypothetical protein